MSHAYRSSRAVIMFIAVAACTLAADLALKSWSFAHVAGVPVVLDPQFTGENAMIPPHQPRVLIPHVLNLQLVANDGAVFGSFPGGRIVFIIVSIAAVVVIGYLFARSSAKAWVTHVLLALILAGAMGNLYDRVRFAQVRDMLHMLPDLGVWPWRFNLADAALMIGVGGLLLISLRKRSAVEEEPKHD
ncbi:MAG: signal peptidase II [Phycisphaeraceae bacterium]|nr:signal peptidase II [Phycisphaeraceae bacterium]